MIQLIRPRAKNVVVLTVTTVNLFAFVACIAVHVASFAGATPSSAALAIWSVGMIAGTFVTLSVIGDGSGDEFGRSRDPAPRPLWFTIVWGALVLYFVITALCLSGPPGRPQSGAEMQVHERANWRIMSAFGTLWLFNLGYSSLLACWQQHRRRLPRARLWPALGYHARHHDQHRRQDS